MTQNLLGWFQGGEKKKRSYRIPTYFNVEKEKGKVERVNDLQKKERKNKTHLVRWVWGTGIPQT